MTPTELAAIWRPTAAVSREAGHKPTSPLKAIRAKCYDCSYFQLIRLCEAVNCALWPPLLEFAPAAFDDEVA